MKRNQSDIQYIKEPFGRITGRLIFRWIRRALLLLIVAGCLGTIYIYKQIETVLTGPSPTARDQLALALYSSEKTAWLPGRFMDPKDIAALGSVTGDPDDREEQNDEPLEINMDLPVSAQISEWDDYPDGIQIQKIPGETFQSYVLLIKDPSRVYLGISSQKLSASTPGKRMNEAMESEKAAAAINAGAFFDNGTSELTVGATPEGLVMSNGTCAWEHGTPPSRGFAGFTKEHKLYVSKDNISRQKAEELGIRDGCCFGPALIVDGVPNKDAYEKIKGRQPRTAIGQREDGTVIFLCIDGRQASSVGGTMEDTANLMLELGAVNACNMDGGSSTVMMYRDILGRYGEADKTYMVNSYSQLQPEPRRMPDYWMVRPEKEG